MKQEKGILYVCATPIGHLSDCSYRLIDILGSVSYIAAENTRKTKILLSRYKIKAKVISLQKYNEESRVSLIGEWLAQGKDVAIVSDAGTPNIADPGAYLIKQMHNKGFTVSPVPGPSAVTALFSVSGMLASKFCFMGFFPKKQSEAEKLLGSLAKINEPLFFFETAKRLLKTMKWLSVNYNIDAVYLGKELTKIHETFYSGPIELVIKQLENTSIKGEWSFIIKLGKIEDDAVEKVARLKKSGLNNKQIIETAAMMGFKRNHIYNILCNQSY
ncbi:MAG: 16S rRNA (cytidine(1402)-2'-O)-methyltransferase [bacterium]|nr:16S rRNA (cytidine(1402)-2'-O)-methyltransferase [bacterium]